MKVWIRMGTLHIRAAIMANSPALGVSEWTICGFSLRNRMMSLISAIKSFKGAMWRSIGIAQVLTPSLSATLCNSSPDEETANTS